MEKSGKHYYMLKMNTIGGIIDMDGFKINKKFHCKELGTLRMDKEVAVSWHFDIGIEWTDLTYKDKKACMYLTKYIHKLPFHTTWSESTLPLSHLDDIVKDFYNDIGQRMIAYKGGNIERDLLKKLNIPGINLEDYGCPKAESLFNKQVWLETCGQHIGTDPYKHCPKTEVEAFGFWVKEQLM